MTVWRYTAVALQDDSVRQRGELAGESAAAVRASLRRVGLRVIDVRPVRRRHIATWPGRPLVAGHLRRRRVPLKGELFDSLATLLDSGLPLAESVGTVLSSSGRRRTRSMLGQVRESLRAGEPLSAAMRAHDTWFDPVEIAMVEAGQHSGELADVLRNLALRHERTSELTSRLASALAYPAIVACVGVGVVVFLSTRTLPQLVGVLEQAKVGTPPLTRAVMSVGQGLADGWPWIVVGILLATAAAGWAAQALDRRNLEWPRTLRRLIPATFRRVRLAQLASGLAELTRSGVPVGEALRVLSPTFAGPVAGSLGRRLRDASRRLEEGAELPGALDDALWFDAEFRQLLAIGQASGELDTLLDRVADRYSRSAKRAIDRLAALLEPAVILALAALIGTVVMAAVLPMLRLQEVLR